MASLKTHTFTTVVLRKARSVDQRATFEALANVQADQVISPNARIMNRFYPAGNQGPGTFLGTTRGFNVFWNYYENT